MLLKKIKDIKKEEVIENVAPAFTDLRQVIDYSRPFTIFFSGVEYETYLDLLYSMGIRNFLMSYEYLKGKGLKQLKKYPDMHLFIDSGAYTYQSDPKYEDFEIEDWEKQIKEYLSWAEKHKNSIFAIADLDLQLLPKIGVDVVYEWRKKYFEPFMLKTGVPVCFIYHGEGLDKWDYMCKRYPYVGFSMNDTDPEYLKQLLNIAEKHNAVCQGMASTKSALLTQYPLYTADSTTWNVGLKYGEISVWDGTKMHRVKKSDFDKRAFPFIDKYDRYFDRNLILEEDKEEMIRVNAYAFIEAEKFIRERLKSKMYWLKQKTEKKDINKIDSDFYPPFNWFYGEMLDIEDYAKKMNVNPEFEGLYNVLYDITAIMNWGKADYKEMQEEYLKDDSKLLNELHDFYINRIVPDNEIKIKDLQKFFADCIEGNNDFLLQLGTNFDRTVKERESYVEDREEELVEASNEELNYRLLKALPPSAMDSMPEISELDEEIFKKAEIIPTFDDKGRFIKGQVSVRKPKKMYSEKYPKFACDTCYAAAKCPEFKAGYACAYNKMFNRFDTRNMSDIVQAMQGMINYNLARMQKAMIQETVSGVIDPQVTGFINQNVQLLGNLKSMYEQSSAEILRQSRVIKADGSREEVTQITNPQSGGILEKLFGGNGAYNTNNTNSNTNNVVLDNSNSILLGGQDEKPKNLNARYLNNSEDE